MDRRTFLTTAALAASQAHGANDRISYGLIGSGGRGRYVSKIFPMSMSRISILD